ncbi:MAG: ABC transporter substrate-binding protein [Dehalobacterium sp.]
MRKKKMGRFSAVLFTITLMIMTCFSIRPAQAEGEENNVLRVGVFNEIESINPLVAYSTSAYEVFKLNYNLLITWDENLNPIPELAKDWTVSEDGQEWTFHLQEGVKWHDGQPFTSADVKFTFEYIRDNTIGYFYDYVSKMTAIETPDEHTVTIVTEQPLSWMPQIWVPILPKHIWENIDPAEASSTYPNEDPIGTGPFTLGEYKKGEYCRLIANPDYFKGAPKINEVIFKIFANESTAAEALKLGEVDILTKMSAVPFNSLEGQENIKTLYSNSAGFTEIVVNHWADSQSKGNPLLRDKNIRKAMSYAIDRQYLIDAVTFGYGEIGTTLVPPMFKSWHYEPTPGEMHNFDLEKAKQILEDAGYKDGNGDGVREGSDGSPLDFRLTLRSESAEQQKMGRIIAEWWKQIGINITIDVVDSGTLTDRLYDNGDFDMYIWTYFMDVDPTSILKIMTTDQIMSWNDSFYSNPVYDDLFIKQDQEMDKEKRREIIYEMQRIIYDDCPYIILAYGPELEAYRTDRFEGWVRTPVDGTVLMTHSMATYENLAPIAQAATQEATGEESAPPEAGKSSTWIWVLVIVAAIAGSILVSRRKKKDIDD